MGPPGGGKGTISKKILKDFSFTHLSTGDVLRANVRAGTEIGKEAETYMKAGSLVPDDVMVRLVLAEVENCSSAASILLDGFPRTVPQAIELDKHISVDLALNLNIPTEVIVERISNRWIHPGSSRVYAYDYNPPKIEGFDDETGEPLVQRDDDKPEAVRTRLLTYEKETAPLIAYYQAEGVLTSFSGTESDVIYPIVKAHLEKELSKVAAMRTEMQR
eukprot:CAMPEP_0172590722 /NCGR_PEP_ID=MMETSP1068-20121228/9351_1 /TAXON_ID=35684 /ORGANISM="Pseudopedinella elastica, Strain CCMP716" /LENGTH=217 /DNA_ID=CAMNT_0013386785 /DNA_START=125 /DNA_END=778 /DNA_ORIENTATION=-